MDFLKAELHRLTTEEEERKRAYHGGRADLQEIWDKLVSLRTFINKFESEIESAKIEDIMRGVGSVEAMNYILPSRNANTSMTVSSASRVADINKLKEKLRMKEILKGRVAVLEERIVEGRRHLAKCSDAMKQGAVNYTLSTDHCNLLLSTNELSGGGQLSANAGAVARSVDLRNALLTISGRVNSWEDELLKSNNELKMLEADLSREISDSTLSNHEASMYGNNNRTTTSGALGSNALTPHKSSAPQQSVYSSARKAFSSTNTSTDDGVLDIITHGPPLSSDLINALRQGPEAVFDASSNRTATGLSLSDCEFSLYEVMSGQAGVTRMNGESPKMYIMRLQKRLGSLLTLELQIQLEFQAKVGEVKHNRDMLREVEIKRLRVELQVSNVQHTLQQAQITHAINLQYHNNVHSTGDSVGNVTLIESTPGPVSARPELFSQFQPYPPRAASPVLSYRDRMSITYNDAAQSPVSPSSGRCGKKDSKLHSPGRGVQRILLTGSLSPQSARPSTTSPQISAGTSSSSTGNGVGTGTKDAAGGAVPLDARRPAPVITEHPQESVDLHAQSTPSAQRADSPVPGTTQGRGITAASVPTSGTKNTSYQESAYHAGAILSDIMKHQARRFAVIEDSAQETSFFSPDQKTGNPSMSAGNNRNSAAKSPSTKEIHQLIMQYIHDHSLDPHVHYAGIIKAIKIQVLSKLLQRDLSQAEVTDTAHLISVSSPTPVGVTGSNRLQRYFAAEDAPMSPIPLPSEYAQYAHDDNPEHQQQHEQQHQHQQLVIAQSSQRGPGGRSSQHRDSGTAHRGAQLSGHGGADSDGSDSSEHSGDDGDDGDAPHSRPKPSTTPKKFQFPNARRSAAGASKKMWMSALKVEPKVDLFLTPQADRLQRLAAKALQSAVSGLSEVYREDGNDLQSTLVSTAAGITGSGGGGGGGGHRGRSSSKLKHHSSVRRNCSCDSCRAASIQGESTDEYDYRTRYDRHGHRVNHLGETMSEDPRNSQDLHTLDTVDESPRSSKGSIRSLPSPERSSFEPQASAEKGRRLSRNMMNVSFRSEVDMLAEAAHISDTDEHLALLGQDSPVPPAEADAATGTAAAVTTPAKISSVFEAELPPLINAGVTAAPSPAPVPRWHVAPYAPTPTPKKAKAEPVAAPVASPAPLAHTGQTHTVTVRPGAPRDTSPRPVEHAPAVHRREGSGSGVSGRKTHPAVAKTPTEPPPRFSTSMKVAASPARHHAPVSATSTSGQDDSPPRFRFCTICSTLVSPHGTSSAAHTAPHGGKHSGAHGIACSHPEHHEHQLHRTPMAAVKSDLHSDKRDLSPQSLRPRLSTQDDEPEPLRSSSPPRPERLSSPGRNASPGRPRLAQEQFFAGADGLQGGQFSPVRRSLPTAADFTGATGADGQLAGLTLPPESAVRQTSSSSRDGGTSLFPHTSVATTEAAGKSGLGDLQDLLNKLEQQQREIDVLRQSHSARLTLTQHTPGKVTSETTSAGFTSLTNAHPALLHSTNLNLGSPHLKVAGSLMHSYKASSTDQLQAQLSVSKPRLGGSTGQFHGNMTPNSTVRSHDSHRGGDSPQSALHTTTVGAHTVTRTEAQGPHSLPHGLPHSETPVFTLPSQGPQPAYHTREYHSPVWTGQSLNLTELAVGSPHFADTREHHQQQQVPPGPIPAPVTAKESAYVPHLGAPIAVPHTTDATVLQIFRCLQERIERLQQRYRQACSQERIHPQYNIALNADGTSRAYADVNVICARNLPVMKRQQKSSDAYIELQLITQFPTHHHHSTAAAAGAGMHTVRVDTSSFLSGQVYNRLDLLYQAHNYAQFGWPAQGVNAHLLDTKVDLVDCGVQFNAYSRTTVKESSLFPEWRESFKFTSLAYLPSQSIVFVIKDATYAARHQVDADDTVVGFAVLPLSATLLADQHPHVVWLPLQQPPQLRHAAVHRLPEDCALKVEVKVHFSEQEYWRHLLTEAELILRKVSSSLAATQQHQQGQGAHSTPAASDLTPAEGKKLEKWLDAMVAAGTMMTRPAALAPPQALPQAQHPALQQTAAAQVSDRMQHAYRADLRGAQEHLGPREEQPYRNAAQQVAPTVSAEQSNTHYNFEHTPATPALVAAPLLPSQIAQHAQPVAFQGHVPLEQRPHHLNYAHALSTNHNEAARPAVPHLPLTVSEPSMYMHDPERREEDHQYQPPQEDLMSPMAFSAISSVTNSPTAQASYPRGGRFFGTDRASERAFTTPGQAKPQNLYPATPLVNYSGRPATRTRKIDISNDAPAEASRTDSGNKGRLKIVGLREQSNRDVFLKTLRSDTTSVKKTTSRPLGVSTVPLPAELFRTPASAQPTTDYRMVPSARRPIGTAPPPLPVQQRLYQETQPVPVQARVQGTQGQGAPFSAVKSGNKLVPPPLPIQSLPLSPLRGQAPATSNAAPATQPRVDLSIFKRAGTDKVYQGEVRSDVGNKLQRSAQSRNEKLGFLSAGPKLLKF